MKKFYESPVVELTGFSAEDVITTSVISASSENFDEYKNEFTAAVKDLGATENIVENYSTYSW